VTRVINRSFVRAERLGTRCAIARLRRAYPATPYEVVELASFKHTLEMAVKTKRSSVRTALLASASLALVRNAQAAFPDFAESYPSGTANADRCAALRFDATSGAPIDPTTAGYTTGLAGAVPLATPVAAPDGWEDCKVASGYYLSAGATSTTDGTNLVVEKVPANFFSTVSSSVEVVLYAASAATWDGSSTGAALTGTGVTECPTNTNTNSATGSDAMADCKVDAGYYVSAGGGATGTAGTLTRAPANHFAAGGVAVDTTTATEIWDGTAGNLAAATGAGVTKCPFGGNSAAGSSALTACNPDCFNTNWGSGAVPTFPSGTCQCAANWYGSPLDASSATAAAAIAGCTKCPFGGGAVAGSTTLTACTPNCAITNTGSGAVANGGTCQCAANYYGSPLDTNGATVAAASTGCTACSAGTTSTAGTTASSGCTGASPTAADSAGASTPIAVALAAAAAVPLLL